MLEELPQELLLSIVQFLEVPDLLNCEQISHCLRHFLVSRTSKLRKLHETVLFRNKKGADIVISLRDVPPFCFDRIPRRITGDSSDVVSKKRRLSRVIDAEPTSDEIFKELFSRMERYVSFNRISFHDIDGPLIAEIMQLATSGIRFLNVQGKHVNVEEDFFMCPLAGQLKELIVNVQSCGLTDRALLALNAEYLVADPTPE